MKFFFSFIQLFSPNLVKKRPKLSKKSTRRICTVLYSTFNWKVIFYSLWFLFVYLEIIIYLPRVKIRKDCGFFFIVLRQGGFADSVARLRLHAYLPCGRQAGALSTKLRRTPTTQLRHTSSPTCVVHADISLTHPPPPGKDSGMSGKSLSNSSLSFFVTKFCIIIL